MAESSFLYSALLVCRNTSFSTSAVSPAATAVVSSNAASMLGAVGGSGVALPELQLYNSMSRTKEVFTAREGMGNAVSMYICGVTVYSMSHIGETLQSFMYRTTCSL